MKEWISWQQAEEEYTLSQEELCNLCAYGKLTAYNKDHEPVIPIFGPNCDATTNPSITWVRIFLSPSEEITFDPIPEHERILFKVFPNTGDFLIIRKDIAPTIHDELLYRALEHIEFPAKLTLDFWESLIADARPDEKHFIPQTDFTYPSIYSTPAFFGQFTSPHHPEIGDTALTFTEEIFATQDNYAPLKITWTTRKFGTESKGSLELIFAPPPNQKETPPDVDAEHDDFTVAERALFHILPSQDADKRLSNEQIWTNYYNKKFIIQTQNRPYLKLKFDTLECYVPPIQILPKAFLLRPSKSYVTQKDLLELIDLASHLAFYNSDNDYRDDNIILLHPLWYINTYPSASDQMADFTQYLHTFTFRNDELSRQKKKIVPYDTYLKDIHRRYLKVAREQNNFSDEAPYTAMAYKLQEPKKDHITTYDYIFEHRINPYFDDKVQSPGAKKTFISKKLRKIDHPSLPKQQPNWLSFTEEKRDKWLQEVAETENIELYYKK